MTKAAVLDCIGGRLTTPTRKEIAEALSLRPVSVSDVVAELLEAGLVVEGDVRSQGRRGRPEMILQMNWNRATSIAVYTQARELRGALVNWSGAICAEQTVSMERDATQAAFEEQFCTIIDRLSRRAAGSELLGVGLSLVGTVDPARKSWLSSARWSRIDGLDFAALERRMRLSMTVSRALDAELTSLLETDRAAHDQNTLLFHWGFGVGSAYAHRGQVLRSTIGRFGEIGHTNTGGKERCLCGKAGCLETEAALWALLPKLRHRSADAPVSEADLVDFLGRPEIAESKVIARATRHVQQGLFNLYEILHPDRIFLIGPFTEVPAIRRKLQQGFKAALPSYARNTVTLSAVEGGFRGCIHGGTRPLFDQWLERQISAQA